MNLFSCRVGTSTGEVLQKEVRASSKEDAIKSLQSSGFHVFEVKRKIPIGFKSKKIPIKDFLVFNQEFQALLKAGIPIFNGLNMLAKRGKNSNFNEILVSIISLIKEGKSLSQAFLEFADKFPPLYPSILLAGEKSGQLDTVLNNYITYERLLFATKKKVKSAFIYPAFLIFAAILSVGVIITVVLPKFEDFYKGFNKELPAITKTVQAISIFLVTHYVTILITLGLLFILFSYGIKTDKGKIIFENLILNIPLIGDIYKKYILSQFTRTLAIMLEGGIPVVDSLETLSETNISSIFSEKLKESVKMVRAGKNISKSLDNNRFVDDMTIDMIKIGEDSGSLPLMLINSADYQDDDLNAKLNGIVSIIAPAIILFLGAIIAFILIAMYLPLFEISDIVS